MNEEILLLRIPPELIRKIKFQKYLPLPLIEPQQPRNIGLCGFDGLKLLINVTGGNSGASYDIVQKCDQYTKQEFYRLVGVSKMAMIGSIKKCSTDYDISPAFFDNYPYFDGQASITTTEHEVVNNWLKSLISVPYTPKPILPYTGALARAMAEV